MKETTKNNETQEKTQQKDNRRKPAQSGDQKKLSAVDKAKNAAKKTAEALAWGQKNQNTSKKNKQSASVSDAKIRVIPLGGLYEVGKNLTVIESGDEIMLIDCGMTFPGDDMLGIDVVIPDFTYLEQNRDKVKGLILTHGHEDHIGGIPYLIRHLNLPIYGTRLVLGLLENKLKEHGLKADLHIIKPGQKINIGSSFKIETIKTNHSFSEALALAIETPAGVIFHTGDFKIDYTPLDGKPIDFHKIAEIGKKGVLLLLSDSTNSERKGYTKSEKTVGTTLDNIFRDTKSRIIIASFASNVDRIQHIIELAAKNGKKVAVSGRSMVNIVALASELGYMKVPENTIVDINKIKGIKDEELVIVTTGSQGEPMSALTRMATNEHRSVKIKQHDVVIFSSSPIPGNEKTVSNVVNLLLEKGANVIYNEIADIHVSGHACQEEQKLMMALLKPKYFMPVHGEYRHLVSHAETAISMGIPKKNIFVMKNGNILELTSKSAQLLKEDAPAGKIFVDGLGVGDIGNIVLRDRKLLSESGLIIVVTAINKEGCFIVSGPEIVSRGFVYVRESEELIKAVKANVVNSIEVSLSNGFKDWNTLKNTVRDELRSFIYLQTKRNPMIIPVFIEM